MKRLVVVLEEVLTSHDLDAGKKLRLNAVTSLLINLLASWKSFASYRMLGYGSAKP